MLGHKTRKPRIIMNALVKVPTMIPEKTLEFLKEYSAAEKISVSRLIAIAIDNEMDCSPMFKYFTEIPIDPPYVEGAYHDQAVKLYRYLQKFSYGLSIDMIVLARREFGLLDRQEALLALRELLEKGLAEITKSPWAESKAKFIKLRDPYAKQNVKYKEIKPLEGPLADVDNNE